MIVSSASSQFFSRLLFTSHVYRNTRHTGQIRHAAVPTCKVSIRRRDRTMSLRRSRHGRAGFEIDPGRSSTFIRHSSNSLHALKTITQRYSCQTQATTTKVSYSRQSLSLSRVQPFLHPHQWSGQAIRRLSTACWDLTLRALVEPGIPERVCHKRHLSLRHSPDVQCDADRRSFALFANT